MNQPNRGTPAGAAPYDDLFVAFQTTLAGRYSLERELGRGGMGIVYLAREVRLDRLVALKLFPPALAAVPRLRERFLREARTAARLSHPHIVPIFTVDEVDRYVFFAMAFVEGETLGQRVRTRGPMPPSEAARMLREVAWALGYAHEQGVVHRDVKPDNILLEAATGRALVADFGIAGLQQDATTQQTGEVVGTPEFMSPEQAGGARVDAQSDLYSLGVVAFYALSGGVPFTGAKSAEVLAKHMTQPAPPIAEHAPAVPRRIARIVASRARGLLKVGFEHSDLAVAFKTEIERGREERAFSVNPRPSVLERITRLVAAVGIGVPLVAVIVTPSLSTVSRTFVTIMSVLAAIGWPTAIGYLALLQRRRDIDTEFWGKLWTGPIGRWLFRIARTVLPKRAIPQAMTHRPTELAIAMAAEQLFAELPKATRRLLGDLPAVVHRLEGDAQRMRTRLEELQDVVVEVPARSGEHPSDRVARQLREERDTVQKQLADAVAALENIRLGLLRLRSGGGSVQSLTTDLAAAGAVGEAVDLLLEGQREVEATLARPALPPVPADPTAGSTPDEGPA